MNGWMNESIGEIYGWKGRERKGGRDVDEWMSGSCYNEDEGEDGKKKETKFIDYSYRVFEESEEGWSGR